VRGRKRKPRTEDAAAAATSDLADAEAARAEDAVMREAIPRSLEDLVPADKAMPMDASLDWSRWDWERKEAEQQRQLLDLVAARRRTAAQPAREAPVVKLEDSSDDEWYRPTLHRGPAVGPPARAASRRRPRRTATTPATTAAATTRCSTAVWAYRTPCF
jgi:hypothetical protein